MRDNRVHQRLLRFRRDIYHKYIAVERKTIMIEIRTLKCGLRMVLEKLPYVESVTAGIWVKAGAVNEDDSTRGISHFIEHMMFKGTGSRTARQIASDIDALGAQINAFTSKESTCYYVKSLSSTLDKACDILIDMMTDSKFDPVELGKERQVVKEEIKMVEDNPEDDVQDMMYEVLFKDHPLSGSILGTPEGLDRYTGDDLRAYIAKEYALDHIVVSVAGKADTYVKLWFFKGASVEVISFFPSLSENSFPQSKHSQCSMTPDSVQVELIGFL